MAKSLFEQLGGTYHEENGYFTPDLKLPDEGGIHHGIKHTGTIERLRVERKLTLEQLAEQTGLSKSALGSYESDDYKDISHHAINRLADFYGVTTDYLLARTETKATQT